MSLLRPGGTLTEDVKERPDWLFRLSNAEELQFPQPESTTKSSVCPKLT